MIKQMDTVKMGSTAYYGNGEFEFIIDTGNRALYRNMHNAVTQTELWDWLRDFEPEEGKGFMFSDTLEINRINNKMREDPISDNHSGASYGCMMRTMQYIAKNGYDKYRIEYTNKR